MNTTERRCTCSAPTVRYVRETAGGSSVPHITGYASVFWVEGQMGTEYQLADDIRERVHPLAFNRALREQDDCRALWNHQAECILGRCSAGTLKLSVDSKGLRYDIATPDTQLGRDLVTSIKRGDIKESSFQFAVEDENWLEDVQGGYIRELRQVQLIDVSPVVWAAYQSTDVQARHVVDPDAIERGRKGRGGRDWWKGRTDRYTARARALEVEVEASHAHRARHLRILELSNQ
jgi:HK97 family phage prohead protease